ncbi:MAG: hypothetical protein DME81_10160 [Verrucomicrobia bacterium]|nr:MAG: hypothetical protein DME81_10160 [Verrucomicrobiota bacterium]
MTFLRSESFADTNRCAIGTAGGKTFHLALDLAEAENKRAVDATDVFGEIDKARAWLKHPQYGLGGAVPLDYAETEIGAREVDNLLGRIDYGVYS